MRRTVLVIGCLSILPWIALYISSPGIQLDPLEAQIRDDKLGIRVEIDGIPASAFKSVGGLKTETEVIEYQEGGESFVRKRPGRTKYSNIVLKRGYVSGRDPFWDWYKSIADGMPVERKQGNIILMSPSGTEVGRYHFENGWPCKWKGFELLSEGAVLSVEEIELAVEKLERA